MPESKVDSEGVVQDLVGCIVPWPKSLGKMMKFSPVQKELQQWNWILPAECRIRMLVA